jgi:hypothetical protein
MTWPSVNEAEQLLSWAQGQNPGPWIAHCRAAARAAEMIAGRCGLEAERAYVSGLLHDIGYYANADGSGRVCHVYAGYALMKEKGYDGVAGICLSHSFTSRDIRTYSGARLTADPEKRAIIVKYLAEAAYNDYDKLIQLSDCIGSAEGICTIERRCTDVVMRHGFHAHTIGKWKAFFALKDYFDKKCGQNIYSLFRDEICDGIFN